MTIPTITPGIWLSSAEIAALPMTGAAWSNVLSVANAAYSGPATLADQDSNVSCQALAKALVYAKTGIDSYRLQVESALSTIANTNSEDDPGSRSLSVGRELCAYVIAADLIQLQTSNPTLDAQFRAKLTLLLDKVLPDGRTLTTCHEDRPNNWGTHCGASRAAVAAYLGDMVELARVAQVFHGWLGDTSSYNGFDFNDDLSWQSNPGTPRAVNPVGAVISGHNVDGALPEEMRRGAPFQWPPACTGYAWEALQGSIVQAQILHRYGYPAWQWENQALKRAALFLESITALNTCWEPTSDDNWQPWLINRAYGEDVVTPTTSPTSFGKNMGFTDWTHAIVVNAAPVVDAGFDQSIAYGSPINLIGTATDDGLPSGTLTYQWAMVSGPGVVTFGNINDLSTIANFSTVGTYVLQLTASDGSLSSVDDVTVTVGLSNNPPVANAGSTLYVSFPFVSTTINGWAIDDGLPSGIINSSWSQISGQPGVMFFPANNPVTLVTFPAPGTYILRLTADDGALNHTDDVMVVVESAPPTNQAPIVNAGVDQTITLPSGATLAGSATDDGLPSGTLTVTWSVFSGNGPVAFSSPNAAITGATFTNPGTYWLRLSAFDGDKTSSDDVLITVNPAPNQAPIADAGADQTITLPGGATLSGSATDDGLPSGVINYSWLQVSGPGVVTFANQASAATTATFSVAGAYVLRLTADDSALSDNDEVIITVNAAPPINQPPSVNAGVDQTITLPGGATLSGSATDDGLPSGIINYSWLQVSGPGVVTFANQASPTTTATFSASGAYVLRLTADDSALSDNDEVTITVNAAPPINQPPSVNAGIDQTVTLPSGATLSGSASDDGLPSGTLTYQWTVVSGPGVVAFANPASAATTATFSIAGAYVLRLTADDSALSDNDEVTITVNAAPPVNQAPAVNAGVDQTVTLPSGATLSGSATDDGLPSGTLTYQWTMVSGPGVVWWANATSPVTSAAFTAPGTYILGLTVSDGQLSGSDTVSITVNAAPPVNQAPAVNAGVDQTVTLPSGATLSGSASDDGLPSGTLTYQWTMVSGPGVVTFANPTSQTTGATFSIAGAYVLRLTASDGVLSDDDEVTIIVNAAPPVNQAPAVNAGVDQTVTLPGSVTLSGNASDDGLPSGTLTYQWTMVSGPGVVTFANPASAATTATFSIAGTYTLRLTASDGALSDNDEIIITVYAPSAGGGGSNNNNGGSMPLLEVTPCSPTTLPPVICKPSRYYGAPRGTAGRGTYQVKGIVIHCLNMDLNVYDSKTCVNRALPPLKNHASLHYAINEIGTIHQYVDDGDVAWGFQTYVGNFPATTPTTAYPGWSVLPAAHPGVSADFYVIHIGVAIPEAVSPGDTDCDDPCADKPLRMTEVGYRNLLRLTRYLADKYSIPIDIQHIHFDEKIRDIQPGEHLCECLEGLCFVCDVSEYCEACTNQADSTFQLSSAIKYLYGQDENGCKVKISIPTLKGLLGL